MTARCGSVSPEHRAKTCRHCRTIYNARRRSGAPRFGTRHLALAARCELCEIVSGNSRGIRVYRYTLRRAVNVNGLRTSRALGSIGLCDVCITERGLVNNQYLRLVAA